MSKTLHWDCVNNSIIAGPTPTCVRAGVATVVNSAGVREDATANTIRHQHDKDGTPLGWLQERPATNLVFPSSDLATTWAASGVTVDTNVANDHAGNATMDRLNVAVVTSRHEVRRSFTTVSNTRYEVSAYARDDGARYAGVHFGVLGAANDYVTVIADLQTAAITATSTGAVTGTIDSSGVEDCGGGLYRIWMVGRFSSTNATVCLFTSDSATPTFSDGRVSYLGVEGEDIIFGDVQVAEGRSLTSFIPTSVGTVTRNFDEITTSDVTWFNESNGTFAIQSQAFNIDVTQYLWFLSVSGSTLNVHRAWIAAAGYAFIRMSESGTNYSLLGSTEAGTQYDNQVVTQVAWAFQLNDLRASYGGIAETSPITTMSPLVTGLNKLDLGSQDGSTNRFSGIHKYVYYDNETADDAALALLGAGTLPTDSDDDFFLRRRKIARLRQRQRRR